MLIHFVHHQIAMEGPSSQIMSVFYDEGYSKRYDHTPDRILDSVPEKSLLHLNPSTNSNKGFKEIIKWYQTESKKETDQS